MFVSICHFENNPVCFAVFSHLLVGDRRIAVSEGVRRGGPRGQHLGNEKRYNENRFRSMPVQITAFIAVPRH